MTTKDIYVATYDNIDHEGHVERVSESMLALQTFCLKKAEKLVEYQGDDVYELVRKRKGRVITIQLKYKEGGEIIEWYTIRPVKLIPVEPPIEEQIATHQRDIKRWSKWTGSRQIAKEWIAKANAEIERLTRTKD